MNSKKFSFKIDKFEDTNEVLENTNFRKVKIMIMHTGENYNGSIFTEDSIDESINTLPNIPILAYVEKEDSGNKDFKAHESSYDIFTDKDGKIKIREYFNEIPIGVVPESNEYFKEEIDGEIYLGCYAYIWKCYSNDAYDILEEDRQKEISMEVLFTDFYDDKNNKCNVNKFEFLAITCLGAKYGGAMGKECNLSMDFSIDNSNSKKMEYATAVEKLNKILKFNEVKEVVNDMSDDKKTFEDICEICGKNPCECEDDTKKEDNAKEDVCKICGKNPCECEKEKEAKEDVCEICGKNPCECEDDTKKEDNAKKIDEDEDKKKEDNACKKKSKNVEEDDDEDEEEIVEDEDGVKKEDEGCKKKSKNSKKTDFSLSLNNIFKGLRYALEEYTYEYTSYWGDTFTCQKYYVEDLMPEDNVAIIYDCEDGECYGVTYSVSNDDVICNLESKTIYLREWRPKVSSVKSFERKEDFKREAVLYNKVAEELHKLRQFKLDVEDRDRLSEIEGKIDGALSQFEFEEDETSELVENVKNGSLDFEMFENMLFALEGRKARAEKEKFSKQQNNNGLKITDSIEDKEVKSKYSSIIDKYGRKNK